MNKSITIYIAFILILCSCEKIIDMDIKDTDRKIVINSVFTDQAPVVVHISKSMHILDDEDFQYINNANIKLFRNKCERERKCKRNISNSIQINLR